jgi:sugar-phosphatase
MTTLSCRALLFDLDGVLVNSTQSIERSWRRWAAGHGLDEPSVIRAAHGRRAAETVHLMAPHLTPESEVAALAAHEARDTQGIDEVPGARELLRALPVTHWAIVTSAVRAVAQFRMQQAKLPAPPVMVCADDVSHGKPHPEGYLMAAALLEVPPTDCIVVEDTAVGLTAARAAGMRSIAVATTHRPHELTDATAIVKRLADITVRVHGTQLLVDPAPLTTSDRTPDQ